MAEFTRKSMISGMFNTRDIPITHQEYDQYLKDDILIQHRFPHLTDSEREFLLTGITDEEWDRVMAEHEEGCY